MRQRRDSIRGGGGLQEINAKKFAEGVRERKSCRILTQIASIFGRRDQGSLANVGGGGRSDVKGRGGGSKGEQLLQSC